MFKIKFSKTYDFAVMIQNELDHVIEDYYIAKEDAFCVADGVTRDRTDGKALNYPQSLEEAKDLIANYPNPSGATQAAHICAETFINNISSQNDMNEEKIYNAVANANSEIAKINANREIDYGINDYYGCVAVGGRIINNILYCFSICDCRIKVLDDNYDAIFDTSKVKDNMQYPRPKENSFLYRIIYRGKWNWDNIKFRQHFRKTYRNNNSRRIKNKYTFGVLTGEKSALEFVHIYKVPLDNAKFILAYSDGCDDCLKTKEQIISVINNPEQIQGEKHEKTLIIYEKSN